MGIAATVQSQAELRPGGAESLSDAPSPHVDLGYLPGRTGGLVPGSAARATRKRGALQRFRPWRISSFGVGARLVARAVRAHAHIL